MCTILGLDERELHTFLRSWSPQHGESKKRPETVEGVRRALTQAGKGLSNGKTV